MNNFLSEARKPNDSNENQQPSTARHLITKIRPALALLGRPPLRPPRTPPASSGRVPPSFLTAAAIPPCLRSAPPGRTKPPTAPQNAPHPATRWRRVPVASSLHTTPPANRASHPLPRVRIAHRERLVIEVESRARACRRPGRASSGTCRHPSPLFHLTRAPLARRPEVGITSAWRGSVVAPPNESAAASSTSRSGQAVRLSRSRRYPAPCAAGLGATC